MAEPETRIRFFIPRGSNGPQMTESQFDWFIFSLEERGLIARIPPAILPN